MKKIRKDTARRLFENGNTIYLLPCKANIESPWVSYCTISYDTELSFDGAVNAFEYYNCNNEIGRYTLFFVEV